MSQTYLRRYTDLPALIYLLSEKKLTLLDPQSWDDSNDSHYLSLYREKKNLESVLALCFSQSDETYHHWRVFAGGSGGACIRFKMAELLKAVKKQDGIRNGPVTYLKMGQIRDRQLSVKDLPFLKRHAFQHESEYRLVYESTVARKPKLDVPIPLTSIDRVTLSPWVHPALSEHVKSVLHSIPGCSHMKILRSTLIGNSEWKELGEGAA